ncbi:MAG: ribonuclease P protein component [Victivallaceae bacterium]
MIKANRLTTSAEFGYVRAQGKKFVGRLFVLVAAPSPDGSWKCGVICGRKFSKLAVVRNRARRLIYEAVRLNRASLAAAHCVMLPRYGIGAVKCGEVERELLYLAKKAGIKVAISSDVMPSK